MTHPTAEQAAMARLKELTPYMGDKEREKCVRENRSETYTTFLMGWKAAHASAEVLALVECLIKVLDAECTMDWAQELAKAALAQWEARGK